MRLCVKPNCELTKKGMRLKGLLRKSMQQWVEFRVNMIKLKRNIRKCSEKGE